MKNLVIGNTSQLSHYFPKDHICISSRNIDFEYLRNNRWDSVYITFAEQRIYDHNIDYIGPNYIYTLKIIKTLLDCSNRIITYGSCELWNRLIGSIEPTTSPDFFPLTNEYTLSKLLLLNKVKELRNRDNRYDKVIFIHPFYFNSIYRKDYFLFGKIYDSIVNKKKIQVGSLNFNRDMVHASFVVKKSIEATNDLVVGSGQLFNIKTFVQDLYKQCGLDFNSLVCEDIADPVKNPKMITAHVNWNYTYDDLLQDSYQEIRKYGNDSRTHR